MSNKEQLYEELSETETKLREAVLDWVTLLPKTKSMINFGMDPCINRLECIKAKTEVDALWNKMCEIGAKITNYQD